MASLVLLLKLGRDGPDERRLGLSFDTLPLGDPGLDARRSEADVGEVLVERGKREERLKGRETKDRRGGEEVVEVGEAAVGVGGKRVT